MLVTAPGPALVAARATGVRPGAPSLSIERGMIAAGPGIAPVIPSTLRLIERNSIVRNRHNVGCVQPKVRLGPILEAALHATSGFVAW